MIPDSHPTVERLLAILDQKHHWAYPFLRRPGLSREQLLVHFRHEYAVSVRDYPILLARCLGQVPDVVAVRRALADNLHDKQTGAISKSAPHAELFLRMMEGLGFTRADFDDSALHPSARSYRDWLFATAAKGPWQAAAALLTIFVEGSVNERAELVGTFQRRRGDAAVTSHPLVVHYGCPPSAMQIVRAHGAVEVAHRAEAWNILLDNVTDPDVESAIVGTCMEALVRWHRYRDGVAERMGLERDGATTAPPPVVMLRAM